VIHRTAGFLLFLIALPAAAAVRQASDAWPDLTREAGELGHQGRFAEAAAVLRRMVRLADQPGQDPERTSAACNWLAVVYDELGRSADAEHEYRRSLALLERSGGRTTAEYAQVLSNLAAHYADLGRDDEAAPLLREAIGTFRSIRPEPPLGLALARDAMAMVAMHAGRYQEADALEQQAVQALEKLPGSAEQYGIALGNLATLRRSEGYPEEAVGIAHRAFETLEKALGPDHPRLIPALNTLAAAQMDLKHVEEAGAALSRALKLAETRLGTDHLLYGRVLLNYSVFVRKCGDRKRAGKLEAQAREILDQHARANGTNMTVDAAAFRSGNR